MQQQHPYYRLTKDSSSSSSSSSVNSFLFTFTPRPLDTLCSNPLTPETFFYRRLNERFGATANVRFLNFGFPFIIEWMKIQEEAIAVSEQHGHIENRLVDEIRHTLARVGPNVLNMATASTIDAAATAYLLRPDVTNPWFHSIVRLSDCAGRIKSHYIANIFQKFYLPRRWAYFLVGPETTPDELRVFESPVSFGCAFEDYLKRHTLHAIADLATFTLGKLLLFIPSVRHAISQRELFVPPNNTNNRHRSTPRRQQRPHYIWKTYPAPSVKQTFLEIGVAFKNRFVELFLGATGAAIGSVIAGGQGGAAEYWGSMVPSLLLSLIMQKSQISSVLEKVEKEMENQQKLARQEQEDENSRNHSNHRRQHRPTRRGESTNTNQNDEMLENEHEENQVEEERRKYFEQAQQMMMQQQQQQKREQNNQNQPVEVQSPVNKHYPLQHPEQRQIVIDEEQK